MKILITGINGFAGTYLANHLSKIDNSSVIAGVDISTGNFFEKFEGNKNNTELFNIDLTDENDVDKLIRDFIPDQVYHLAAQASVSNSWKEPINTFKNNVFGGVNLLESIRKYNNKCRFLSVCTAEVYGISENPSMPIKEEDRIYPTNPYAISKAALDFFSITYYLGYKIPVFVSRSFNHIGPGQSIGFVCSDFAKQIAQIEKKLRKPEIFVGNLEACRDFLDVRDVVNAYYYIMNKGKPGEVYNICSGEKIKISDILKTLISFSKEKNVAVRVDSSKLRPVDNKIMYGDNSKIKEHTGWLPGYSINETLKDILNYWRNIV
ncbi:MAG TPA: NAD-dependent epimerase/dehydratase family protein [Actinobacteria bacterium]|nr:NAD-dependent epimerase/dehydratase family protein [Actinomycetota bacterium]